MLLYIGRILASALAAVFLSCAFVLLAEAAEQISYVRLTLSYSPAVGETDYSSLSLSGYQREYSSAFEAGIPESEYVPGHAFPVDVALTAFEGYSFSDIKKGSCKLNDVTADDMSVIDGGTGLLLHFELPALSVVLETPENLSLSRAGTASWDEVREADSYSVTIQKINDMGTRSYVKTLETTGPKCDISSLMYASSGDYVFSVRACSQKYWLLESDNALLSVSESVLITRENIGYTENDFDRDGRLCPEGSSGWLHDRTVRVKGKEYRLGSDGYMVSGWILDSGSWYYFDKETLSMKKGLFSAGGREYFADPSDGRMLTGFLTVDGRERFFSEDGHAETGWVRYEGNIYYICPDGQRNREQLIDGNGRTYMFSREDGHLLSCRCRE